MIPATHAQRVLDLATRKGLLRASDLDSLIRTFRAIAGIAVDDGIVFDPASVVAEMIVGATNSSERDLAGIVTALLAPAQQV